LAGLGSPKARAKPRERRSPVPAASGDAPCVHGLSRQDAILIQRMCRALVVFHILVMFHIMRRPVRWPTALHEHVRLETDGGAEFLFSRGLEADG
jgi:hypothetical protein